MAYARLRIGKIQLKYRIGPITDAARKARIVTTACLTGSVLPSNDYLKRHGVGR